MIWRTFTRSVAYSSGALGLFHRIRHGESLTVLMFHRVLPELERNRSSADPTYSIAPKLLAEIVAFVRRNYAIVGMQDVLLSLRRERALPRQPLLITFDDGWQDNIEWALPQLRGIAWTLFVTTDALADPDCWWQEVLLWALRSGRDSYDDLWKKAKADADATGTTENGTDVLALLLRYGSISEDRRRDALSIHTDELRSLGGARHMLTRDELLMLRAEGVAIGSHGATHLPLSRLSDPCADLRKAREFLYQLDGPPVLSFPHGRYDEGVVSAARNLGYKAIFTSEPILNPCPGGWLQSDVIGRISLDEANLSSRMGTVVPERLAAHLYLRDIAIPAVHQP